MRLNPVNIIVLLTVLFSYVVAVTKLKLSSSNQVTWTLENKNGSILVPGTVPGGVYSDLMKAGIIEDILKGFNDVMTRWVAYDDWMYVGKFNVTQGHLSSTVAHMVFHGVDTVADIELNGVLIGSTNNMFRRYVFDVKEHLKMGPNELKVKLSSPVKEARLRSAKFFTLPACPPYEYNGECHVNQLRKMQASFSWDWGPAFPSVGLWKYAEIEFYDVVTLRTVTTHTERKNGFWHLKIRVHLESSMKAKQITLVLQAAMTLERNRREEVQKIITVTTRDNGTAEEDIEMVLSENIIRLWWPNGYGDQNLYDLLVTVIIPNKPDVFLHKKIGFRSVKLVQTNASAILGNGTNGQGLTFHFEINDVPLFMKGSNWIPRHILPENVDRPYVSLLLTAAKEAHMTMLRVWGGGLYEDEFLYELCDELGILVWQDLPFACSMYPVDQEFIENVQAEIKQNVIDLQSHTSIAVWAGNNENEAALRGNWYGTKSQFDKYKTEYVKLYVDTIRPIVENLDDRQYLVSSPTNGVKSEEEGYIAQNPYDPRYGDTHYYNYLADNWDSNTFPFTRFASEYGVQSIPSLATLRQVINTTDDLSMDSSFMKHRQHSPNGYGFIEAQINKRLKLNKDDPEYFEKFVFYSQISQAMSIKTQTEFYRQSQASWYTMGALYWQLNDVWQAPSWSGIEFGGKFKMLHYFAKNFFAPVLVSPRLLSTGDVDIFILNDRFVDIINANITVDVFHWDSLTPICSPSYEGNAPALGSKRQPYRIKLWNQDTEKIFLRFSLKGEGLSSTPFNYIFPKPLKSVKGLRRPNIRVRILRPKEIMGPNTEFSYTVQVSVNTVVLFLWLETKDQRGKFLDNGFVVTEPTVTTTYVRADYIPPRDLQMMITYQYYLH